MSKKVKEKESDGATSVKYPCNVPLKLSGKFSATAIKNCDHNCDECGFNPEESNRRLSEGKILTDSYTGLARLRFPKKKQNNEFKVVKNI